MTKIYIVRHCEAEGNIKRYFQGHTDGQVSEKGKEQCDALAERFRSIPVDAIYSSPLSRTRYTADAVNRYHSLTVQLDPGLIEIDGGQWEGVRWDKISQLYPDEARTWADAPWEFVPRGGEAMANAYDRIWKTVLSIAKENAGKTVAVTTHGGVIRNLFTRIKFGRIQKMAAQGWCDNTAVSLIEFNNEFQPSLIMENDISHLREGMSTLAGQSWWKDGSENKFE